MTKFGSNNVGQTGCVCFSQRMSGLKQASQVPRHTQMLSLPAEYQAPYCKASFSCKLFLCPVYMERSSYWIFLIFKHTKRVQ